MCYGSFVLGVVVGVTTAFMLAGISSLIVHFCGPDPVEGD